MARPHGFEPADESATAVPILFFEHLTPCLARGVDKSLGRVRFLRISYRYVRDWELLTTSECAYWRRIQPFAPDSGSASENEKLQSILSDHMGIYGALGRQSICNCE